MSDVQKAMSIALDYLQSRAIFEKKVESTKMKVYLGGNDNLKYRVLCHALPRASAPVGD